MELLPEDIRQETLPDPQQKTFDGKPFPLVLTPIASARKDFGQWTQWLKDNLNQICELLAVHGAILFRNFPIDGPKDFDTFSKAFRFEHFDYVAGAAVRSKVVGNVVTSNEAPPDELIPFHTELGHQPHYPLNIFFYCDVEPSEGGETPLVLSHVICREMERKEPQFMQRLEQDGVNYNRILSEEDDTSSTLGRGWKSSFQVENKHEAEKWCEKRSMKYEWLADGCMKLTSGPLPAIRRDPNSSNKTWHNSITAVYVTFSDGRNDPKKAVTFPNGDPMPEKAMETLLHVLEENCIAFKWQKNDMVVLDNRLCEHGRRWFKPPRCILAVLCKD